jgi:hypothetical protein
MKIKAEDLRQIIKEELEAVLSEKKGKKTKASKKKKRKKKKKAKKRDACYHKVKSRYKIWPSAYASGALVKCRDMGAKNWGNSKKNEEVERNLTERIEKVDGKYVVYPASGGERLGTHDTREEAEKQLAAIEISKKSKVEELEEKKQSSEDAGDLWNWFNRQGEKGPKGGWVDCKAPDGEGGYKECAQGNRKKKPYCRPTPSACKTEPQRKNK